MMTYGPDYNMSRSIFYCHDRVILRMAGNPDFIDVNQPNFFEDELNPHFLITEAAESIDASQDRNANAEGLNCFISTIWPSVLMPSPIVITNLIALGSNGAASSASSDVLQQPSYNVFDRSLGPLNVAEISLLEGVSVTENAFCRSFSSLDNDVNHSHALIFQDTFPRDTGTRKRRYSKTLPF